MLRFEMKKKVIGLIPTKRRRMGLTSPPLVGIESNPGPRKVGRRVAKTEIVRRKLTDRDKGKLELCLEMNRTVTDTSKLVGVDKKTVSMWWDRYRVTGHMNRKPGSGRPRKLSARIDRRLRLWALRNRRITGAGLAVELRLHFGKTVSARTVKRRLNEGGIYGRRPRIKPFLTTKQRQNRIRWANKHKHWTPLDWESVIWSDETSVTMFPKPTKDWIWRRVGEDFEDGCMGRTVKGHGGKISMWGCFHAKGLGPHFG